MAQSTAAGTVAGKVADQQGAALAGAEVRLTDTGTKVERVTTTNEAGRYTFLNTTPGVYDLTASKTGFTRTKISAQKVDVGLALTLDVALQVGTTTTTVEVAAAAGAELQTENATVGSTLSGDSLVLLPNINRDAATFSVLQVGVTPSGQVAGTQSDQGTFQLDGGNNSDDMAGTNSSYTTSYASNGVPTGVSPTPVESIEEFKIGITNNTADFNGAAGSQVQLVTKRGTNDFHGSLYDYYFASNVGAANSWKNDHTASGGLPYTPLPDTHRNRFGGALGGPLLPRRFKTYFFTNLEGYRFPNATTIEKTVPSALMRAGVIQVPNSAGVYQSYNLNPNPVTVNGRTYQPAMCATGALCDPLGLGLNPVVNQIWSQQMPLANDPQFGDRYNTEGYLAPIKLPISSNFGVLRLDHDFGSRNHFTVNDRYFTLSQATSNQVDIGGVLPGDTFGVAAASAPRPQKNNYLVAGLTTVFSPTLTNDFHFNLIRNYWSWSDAGAPPQLPGLSAALEIGGESSSALIPYNVDSSGTRERAWDGHDQAYRDDLSKLYGNHLFQFGASYQRNYDFYTRNDNGIATDANLVYQVGQGSGISMPAAALPTGLPSSQVTNYTNLYAEVLGIVDQPQVMYTRQGPNLTLNPIGDPTSVRAIVPDYNWYFTDSWHIKPNFTLTYGLSYEIEMPPYELDGKQVQLVDAADNAPISLQEYLAQKEKAALAGSVYDPTIGFATVRNVGTGEKYPFAPFYGQFSPRLAAAWSPKADGWLGNALGHGKTVIRGGYSRIYGRLNGGRVVGSPVLGDGLEQVDQCIGASASGQCLGINGVTPSTAFRIGTNGMTAPLQPVTPTLPQPYFAGVNGAASAGDGAGVDPNFRPDRSDEFTLTVQRELSPRLILEAGYIGRIIRNEYQLVNIDAVPTMTTLGGQSFANAFANIYQEVSGNQAIQAQPFFETALGGSKSSYCAAYSSCTAAVASLDKSYITSTQVYNLWAALNAAPSWILGRTLLASPALAGGSVGTQLTSYEMASSVGFGNYNAAFLRFTSKNYHGITTQSNFTWGRAMGTGDSAQSSSSQTVVDPWNLQESYGPQSFDIRFIYNLAVLYQVPFFRDQKGILGRALGGWTIAPLFTAQSGAPLEVSIGTGSNADAQSFGEEYGNSNTALENAVLTAPYTGGNSAHYNVSVASGAGINGNASTGGSGINMFANPAATFADFRPMILGLDTTGGGAGVLRGFPTWNLDATASKDFRIRERLAATVLFQFTNVLNHFQPSNPSLNIDSPQTWGVVTGQSNTPRQLEFGVRVHF